MDLDLYEEWQRQGFIRRDNEIGEEMSDFDVVFGWTMCKDEEIAPNLSDRMIREIEANSEENMMGWIGVDLDGTLAYYDEWRGVNHIGKPVPAMLERVRRWVEEGKRVKIFTARASVPEFDVAVVHGWLTELGLPELEVTNAKDYAMIECWDDRCIQVEPNTGRRVDGGD